jgi:aryl-alcohol dehydrogenase-like predicted oxidoreductase
MQPLPRERLGPTDVEIAPIGVGCWQWGDRRMWGFEPRRDIQQAREAFNAALDAGVTLFDTAESYGRGLSERMLGRFVRESGRKAFIASKFAPLPWRVQAGALPAALDGTLARMKLGHIDLYQVHFPWSPRAIETWMDQMADEVEAGRIRYVGVSNFNRDQMLRAHEALNRRGIWLVSNQVHYSLLHREPERIGLIDAARAHGISVIAYSPLEQGVLSGRYYPGGPAPTGMRRWRGHFRNIGKVMPLVEALDVLAKSYGRTPSQVALNWLARQPGVIAIPGARNAGQARDNAAALTFTLEDRDAELLDRVSYAVSRS